jgi:hypothetical protein
LVGKCFCVAGKDDISSAFKGRNYGVGCPGGVEVVVYFLCETLQKHKSSKLNAFNEIKREHFMKCVSEMFPAMSNGLSDVTVMRQVTL